MLGNEPYLLGSENYRSSSLGLGKARGETPRFDVAQQAFPRDLRDREIIQHREFMKRMSKAQGMFARSTGMRGASRVCRPTRKSKTYVSVFSSYEWHVEHLFSWSMYRSSSSVSCTPLRFRCDVLRAASFGTAPCASWTMHRKEWTLVSLASRSNAARSSSDPSRRFATRTSRCVP